MTTRPVAIVASTIPLTIATFHRELIRQLDHAGYDVLVVASPGRHLELVRDETPARTQALAMNREITPRDDIRALRAWVGLCRRERPALIITTTPKASLLGMVAGRLMRAPRRLYFVGGLRMEGETGIRRSVLRGSEWVAGAAATDVVVNSASLYARARELRIFAEDKLRRTVPGSSHGVDSGRFVPQMANAALKESLGLRQDLPVIGLVGRLTRDKGIDALITALDVMAAAGVHVQLLVVGPQDEPDSAHYLRTLHAHHVSVATVGAVDDVRPYFAIMDLHVLPSLREGFPNVVLEASAMGLATVTTDATGCVDSVVDGQTGLVVPAGNGEQLAFAVGALISDRDRRERMGTTARAWVSKEFQPSVVVRSLLGDLVGRSDADAAVS